MELELNRTEATGYNSLVETTLFSEETLECIVPDSCPDILRIVDCTGTVCIKSREVLDGRAEVRGTVQACVLYLPDGEDALCHMDVTIPFQCSMEHHSAPDGMILHATPGLIGTDARVLNPRKIYIRAEIAVGMQVFAASAGTYTVGTYDAERWGIEEKRESYRIYAVSAVQDKSFTYADELVLPGNKPDIEGLLYYRAELLCGEHKVIGSKLVLKGQVFLKTLYRGAGHSLNTAVFELPFSQIMEMSQACEDATGTVNLYLSEITCQAVADEPRKIAVAMELVAQAVLHRENTVEILTDLYSTDYEVKVERTAESLTGLCERGTRRVPVREVLEIPVAVKSVADCWLSMGEIRQKRDGKVLMLFADVRVSMIYTGEDDGFYALKRPLTVECQIDGEAAEQCTCRCQCTGELYATPTVGGIELRFPLDFEYCTQTKTRMEQVASVSLEETKPCDRTLQPSIVLRLAEAGETLWQIAKAYQTTKQEIALVNELSEEAELAGRLLLIPKKK